MRGVRVALAQTYTAWADSRQLCCGWNSIMAVPRAWFETAEVSQFTLGQSRLLRSFDSLGFYSNEVLRSGAACLRRPLETVGP
jgi:hypothetical protein